MECSVRHHSRIPRTDRKASRGGRRPGNYQDESYLDPPDSQSVPNASDDVVLHWYGKDFTLDYYISRSKPDWSFLDTWYSDEVRELYEMNSSCALSKSLYNYLCQRLFA